MIPRSALVPLLSLALLASHAPRLATRETLRRVPVEGESVRMIDGDTAVIRWRASDAETVRVLGIDTAELLGSKGRHPASERLPITPRGAEARGFARGAFAAAPRIELLRSAYVDRYGRTLGYFFLAGRNYSVLVIEAGLSRETISRYGDNGLPEQAREVLEAARRSRTPLEAVR